MYSKLSFLAAAADLNRISLASWDWIVIAIFFLAMVWICWDVSPSSPPTSAPSTSSASRAPAPPPAWPRPTGKSRAG